MRRRYIWLLTPACAARGNFDGRTHIDLGWPKFAMDGSQEPPSRIKVDPPCSVCGAADGHESIAVEHRAGDPLEAARPGVRIVS